MAINDSNRDDYCRRYNQGNEIKQGEEPELFATGTALEVYIFAETKYEPTHSCKRIRKGRELFHRQKYIFLAGR